MNVINLIDPLKYMCTSCTISLLLKKK